ncbi:MAG TPA: discoidin domain-containing protein [Thermoanaerobaculia bacterium]|nr:discoidin domain-containing protein [Thermoanaerobaculia bacterium]
MAEPLQHDNLLDDFESVATWTSHPSDGVELNIGSAEGLHGRAMRLDFDFHAHAGYAIARRNVDLDLPPNYEFTFSMRADAPVNNLEFKLIDQSGENVWWLNRRDFIFPKEWKEIAIKKRQISFAWGPLGGGELHHVAALEIVITAGSGGKGTVLIDDLRLTPLPPAATGPMTVGPWRASDGGQERLIDLGARREFGGLRIRWDELDFARDFSVQASRDGSTFETLREIVGNDRRDELLYLPDSDARYVRLSMRQSSKGNGYALQSVEVEPIEWASTPNEFFNVVAAQSPLGNYPRYLRGQQSYWTVIGEAGAEPESLVGEDGAVEPQKDGFSIEPFLYDGQTLLTWNDVTLGHSLAEVDLPIPSVTWTASSGVSLVITAAVTRGSDLIIRYTVQGKQDASVKLFLAVRPFQVNPSTQFLNTVGGVSPIHEVRLEEHRLVIDGRERLELPSLPGSVGTVSYDEGDLVDHLRNGTLTPLATDRIDPNGWLSTALVYPMELKSGQPEVVDVVMHLGPAKTFASFSARHVSPEAVTTVLASIASEWRESLNRVAIDIPAAPEIGQTVRTSVAYMLIQRDGAALEPGSRSYDRAWIRDGALMAATLLRLGHADEAKAFAEWFAAYQFENGKVPCCVDRRGADPVPENDSHGELIYLVAEIWRITGDLKLVRTLWPHVDAAARYIETLRAENHGEFEGLVTESISHEGYSAKPMHSYWDDFFALRGLDDAALLASAAGFVDRQREIEHAAADFRHDLAASIRLSIDSHHIDYIPGAAELGDFDATSTAIAISPLNLGGFLPQKELRRTFERYLENLEKPRADYTPYEMRNIGALIRLGRTEDGEVENFAHYATALFQRFLGDRRPAEWNEWAEVVSTDPRRPTFIGDMPHAWVASDFVRSVLDAFAYDREDGALVIAAGVPPEWLRQPLHVGPLPTYSGTIDIHMHAEGDSEFVDLSGTARAKSLIVRSSDARPIRRAVVNGRAVPHGQHEVKVSRLPARVVLSY